MKHDEIRKIAEDHWVFIEGLFFSLPYDVLFDVSTVAYLYKEAFIHGWGHGRENCLQEQDLGKRLMESTKSGGGIRL